MSGWTSVFGGLGAGAAQGALSGGTPATASAADTFAALTREQWANYVETYVPIENQLIAYATDTTLPGKEMAKASENVTNAFAAQEGATQRRLSGLGVSLSADEQQAQQRSTGLAKSLADVQAQNLARTATVSRQQNLLGNPAPDAVTLSAAAK